MKFSFVCFLLAGISILLGGGFIPEFPISLARISFLVFLVLGSLGVVIFIPKEEIGGF